MDYFNTSVTFGSLPLVHTTASISYVAYNSLPWANFLIYKLTIFFVVFTFIADLSKLICGTFYDQKISCGNLFTHSLLKTFTTLSHTFSKTLIFYLYHPYPSKRFSKSARSMKYKIYNIYNEVGFKHICNRKKTYAVQAERYPRPILHETHLQNWRTHLNFWRKQLNMTSWPNKQANCQNINSRPRWHQRDQEWNMPTNFFQDLHNKNQHYANRLALATKMIFKLNALNAKNVHQDPLEGEVIAYGGGNWTITGK